jgi:uncharacterized phage-associated protein
MTSIIDVAAYILQRCGSMTTMKLQKLAFYSQAESLAHSGRPLFPEDFQAWRGGPVSVELYVRHRGMFLIREGALTGTKELTDQEKRLIDSVCSSLAGLTGNQLSSRTHGEDPWREARAGLPQTASCTTKITKDSIRDYYSRNPVCI